MFSISPKVFLILESKLIHVAHTTLSFYFLLRLTSVVSPQTTTESDSKTVSSGSVQAIRELFTTDKGTEFFILTSSTDVSGEQEEEEGQSM